MDLSFSPSQQLLQQSARALLQQRCPIECVQAIALDPRGFAADLWKEIATLGWPGLLVPTELGGSGGSIGDALALVEDHEGIGARIGEPTGQEFAFARIPFAKGREQSGL